MTIASFYIVEGANDCMEYGIWGDGKSRIFSGRHREDTSQPGYHDYEINPKAETPAYVPYDPMPVYQDWARSRARRRLASIGAASSSNFIISVGTDRSRRKRTRRNESESS